MQTIPLSGFIGQDYQYTLSAAAWIAAGYDLVNGLMTKTARVTPTSPVALYFSNMQGASGTIALVGDDSNNGQLTALRFTMPVATILRTVREPITLGYTVALTGALANGAPYTRLLFGGTLTLAQSFNET